MRAIEAVEPLASKITLKFDISHLLIQELPVIPGHPAMEALIQIGNPSIPAVIRNLADSDDAEIRDLSLKALYRIEGDKEIAQLRLQKAMATEKDSQKQARLQAVLKALPEIH
jgi:HEAT repeat protein